MDTCWDIDQARELARAVHNQGYAVIPGFLSPAAVKSLSQELEFDASYINANPPGSVVLHQFRYLPNVIARSQQAYNLVTSPRVLELCRQFFQGPFHLINNRALSNRGYMAMLWHTDNDWVDDDGSLLGRHPLIGLQFLLYLSDARQRPLQLMRGSHHWSAGERNQYISQRDVKRHHSDAVVEVQPDPGTLVVIHTHLYHRAQPFARTGQPRSLLLFQFDATDAEETDHGEDLLLNAAFLNNLTAEVKTILRLGQRRRAPAFPATGLETLSLRESLKLQARLLLQLCRAAVHELLKTRLSDAQVIRLKQSQIERNRLRASVPLPPGRDPSLGK